MADRLLFSKTGRAKYISHLDLMRTFQRAFARAGIAIKHTEGFNPHPFVSIALPLSVGYSSQCEILEFGLLEGADPEEVPRRLTAAMPEGIVIHSCYPAQRPVKELSRVNYIINMEYEEGRPLEAETAPAPPHRMRPPPARTPGSRTGWSSPLTEAARWRRRGGD